MKLKHYMNYKNTEIRQNEKSGNFYLNSPVNGTQRIFRDLDLAKNYIDNCEVLDSNAKGMHD